MILRNKTKSQKRVSVLGRWIIVKPGETIEAPKIKYDERSFEIFRKEEKKKSSTRIPRKLNKRRKI